MKTRIDDWRSPRPNDPELAERVRSLSIRRNGPGLVYFCLHLVLTIAGGALVWAGRATPWLVPALLVHGIVLAYWFQPFHECVHGTAFRTPWLNRAVAWISGGMLLLSPAFFYYEHMQHHRFTQHPDRDPERIPAADRPAGYLLYLTGLPYHFYTIGLLFRHAAGHFTGEERRFLPGSAKATVIRQSRLLLALVAILIATSVHSASTALVYLWLLPRLAGEPVQRMVRLSEHQGCPLVPDLFENTRTVLAAWPLRHLGWMSCYHAEHHLYPSMPFHGAAALHRLIGDRLVRTRPGYVAAHRDIARHLASRQGSGFR